MQSRRGYGITAKKVMVDKTISIEAKAIYAYLCVYANKERVAYPSVDTICRELGIGEKRFYRHRKVLVDKGYISITRNVEQGKLSNNIYHII